MKKIKAGEKMNKRTYSVGILSLMIGILSLSGCSQNETRESLISTKNLTADIQEKYKEDELYEYADALVDVERGYTFEYKVSDEAMEYFRSFSDSWGDIFKVYKDSSFTQEVAFSANRNEEGVLAIAPARKAEYAIPDEELGGYLNDVGEYKDWGNAPQYYMVQYYDVETGEKLKKPIVTYFTIKTEMNTAPIVELTVNEEGIGGLKWDKVKGAKEYIVFTFTESKEGKTSGRYVQILATTEKTSWQDDADSTKINRNFKTFNESVDNQYGELALKLKNGEITEEEFAQEVIIAKESSMNIENNMYLGVIAINKDGGTSKVSNLIDKRKAASQIPYELAYWMNEGGIRSEGDNSKVRVDREINLVSTHAWVTMCDGSAVQKLVNYNTTKVKEDTIHFYSSEEDENGNIKVDENGNPVNFQVEDIDCISVPYTIESTKYKGYAQITNYSKENYKKELEELKKRQEGLRNKTGTVKQKDTVNKEENEGEVAEELSSDYEIKATNALSEYLAIQMLNGEEVVNLDAFKESQDQEYLVDAWYEAVYQNPLILGVEGIRLDTKNNNLMIYYEQDSKEQYAKQKEIKEKVKSIAEEIIDDDMSDYEKEEAINNYLCEHAEYDNDALKNAEENDFETVDEKYNDSFTAYGILIKNKGVCASYAAAFHLLAQEAGLESIVVTGYLEGTLPHAWNRVNIEGQWYTMDVTNNDNEFFANGLFNLSDNASKDILVEDDLYMMNNKLPEYKAEDDWNEFYRKNEKFYDSSSIVDKLVEQLAQENTVSLRTEYTLSEEAFYNIALQVMEKTQNENLKGGYFMGIITLQK